MTLYLSLLLETESVMNEIITGNLFNSLQASVIIAAVAFGLVKGIFYILKSRKNKIDTIYKSFMETVSQLSSRNSTTQLSAAILLRRYLTVFVRKYFFAKDYFLKKETLNVISSILKVLPTSVFQKTVADSLAYTPNLKNVDLQNTNLQDAYLGNKHYKINMSCADLFKADLSSALIENVKAKKAFFYHSILFGTKIKRCNLSYADFRNSDLSNSNFTECILYNANFSGAYNIPPEISATLKNGICTCKKKITTHPKSSIATIFFSIPGAMTISEDLLVNEYHDILKNKGFRVEKYKRDQYPQFGQLGKVRHKIRECSGMIAFGFKQLGIEKAIFRPNTIDEEVWEDRWLSTPWNELEVGMGLMHDIPILLVQDDNLNFGVFDKKLSECFVASISTSSDIQSIDHNPEFKQWLSMIKKDEIAENISETDTIQS